MGYLAPKLKHRIQVVQPVQTPNDDGGFDISYTTLLTIWAAWKPVSEYLKAVRGTQTDDIATDEFKVRHVAVYELGKCFSSAFSSAYNTIEDINSIKDEWFIFFQAGSSTKGRLYRVRGMRRDDKNKEFVIISTTEIEEKGTGYPE